MTTSISKVGIRELRQNASSVLREVKDGNSVIITEHGHPVARIIPIVNGGWEEMIAAGLVVDSQIEDWRPSRTRITLPEGKSASKVLAEMRADEI